MVLGQTDRRTVPNLESPASMMRRLKTGFLYRETNVINKLLCNSEAWYGLKETEIYTFQKIYEAYLRNLFEAHSKTPIESLANSVSFAKTELDCKIT